MSVRSWTRCLSPSIVMTMNNSFTSGEKSISMTIGSLHPFRRGRLSACLKKFASRLTMLINSFFFSGRTYGLSRSIGGPLSALSGACLRSCTIWCAAKARLWMDTGSPSAAHSSIAVRSCLRAASSLVTRICGGRSMLKTPNVK